MVPAVLNATAKLYRAVAIVHAIVWHGSARGVGITPPGLGWIRGNDQLGGFSALLVYVTLVGGAWLAVSTQLPHRDVRWPALLPGAVLFGAGMLFVDPGGATGWT